MIIIMNISFPEFIKNLKHTPNIIKTICDYIDYRL